MKNIDGLNFLHQSGGLLNIKIIFLKTEKNENKTKRLLKNFGKILDIL
jgi:hypothetical protein